MYKHSFCPDGAKRLDNIVFVPKGCSDGVPQAQRLNRNLSSRNSGGQQSGTMVVSVVKTSSRRFGKLSKATALVNGQSGIPPFTPYVLTSSLGREESLSRQALLHATPKSQSLRLILQLAQLPKGI